LIVAVGLAGTSAPGSGRTEPLPPANALFDVPQEEIDEFFNF
jgi:hypothetical protein